MLRYSEKDYDAMVKFDTMVQEYGNVLRNQMLREPPKLGAGVTDLIVKQVMISPLDYEREYGLTEGDIFHGRHDIDQSDKIRFSPITANDQSFVLEFDACLTKIIVYSYFLPVC